MTTLRGLTLEEIPAYNRLSSAGVTVTWDGTRLAVIAEPGKAGFLAMLFRQRKTHLHDDY